MAEKHRILLVEDEESLRLPLKLNFELEGYDPQDPIRFAVAV